MAGTVTALTDYFYRTFQCFAMGAAELGALAWNTTTRGIVFLLAWHQQCLTRIWMRNITTPCGKIKEVIHRSEIAFKVLSLLQHKFLFVCEACLPYTVSYDDACPDTRRS